MSFELINQKEILEKALNRKSLLVVVLKFQRGYPVLKRLLGRRTRNKRSADAYSLTVVFA